MSIIRACCYFGIGFVAAIILLPLDSGDWNTVWYATKWFGWIIVVLAAVVAATYVREK